MLLTPKVFSEIDGLGWGEFGCGTLQMCQERLVSNYKTKYHQVKMIC